MARGTSSFSVQTGGGSARASAAKAARTLIQIGVSPGGLVETLYRLQSRQAIVSTHDTGPLAEAGAMRFRDGQTAYLMPIDPSSEGDTGAVTAGGHNTGAGTVAVTVGPHKAIRVLCTTSGALGTMKVKFSLDGGLTYGDEVASVAGGTWLHRVLGTFTTLTFNAASYVATKTLTVGINGVVTNGSGWVGVVTQASSPIDNYDVLLTVVKGGALGACVISPSLDGGTSTLPNMAVPSGGVVVIPGTGLILTLADTFVLDDTYAFLAAPPSHSTSDLDDCLDALRADANAPPVALIHVLTLSTSAANAISLASTLNTALEDAFTSAGFDWQGVVEAPFVGDTIVSGGAAIADTADTDAVLRTARDGSTFNRASLFVGTHRMQSSLKAFQLKRPLGWALADRYVDTDPKDDVTEVGRGPLPITEMGRDERLATGSLHDVQYNVVETRVGRGTEPYFTIESGGVGWRNMTVDADYQDAQAMRVLNILVAALRVEGDNYLGSRQSTNADGTIHENAALAIDTRLDAVAKRTVGLMPGGDFVEPQASAATASVDRSSQLGTAPRKLVINYSLQPLGFVSDVEGKLRYSGVLTLEG